MVKNEIPELLSDDSSVCIDCLKGNSQIKKLICKPFFPILHFLGLIDTPIKKLIDIEYLFTAYELKTIRVCILVPIVPIL